MAISGVFTLILNKFIHQAQFVIEIRPLLWAKNEFKTDLVCLNNRFGKRKHLISGKIIFKAVSLPRAWSHVFIYIVIFIRASKNPSLQR